MTLVGGRVAITASESVRCNIEICRGRIRRFGDINPRDRILDLHGFLVLPGLINAHDHLEFNLFPRLGRGPYSNATEWARQIYHPRDSPIRQHLQVPKEVRLFWGGIKNLLSGVTTVAHHNPYQAAVFERGFPVRLVKRYGWAHSLGFSSDIRKFYRDTPAGAPFIIHAGEGTDVQSRDEIYRLDRAGVLGTSTVIVHGVAFESEDLNLIARRCASLVWCPTSNHFMLGRTIPPVVFESGIPIALGSDSALTADGDFIDELCAANCIVNLTRLYKMVTTESARVLRLTSGEGSIREGGVADFIVVNDERQTPAESLLDLSPELVMINGRIKLFSTRIADRLCFSGQPPFEPLEVRGRGRWFIACPVSALAARARWELGDGFRRAGREVTA
jgi:cytosine/adenosine deaminase-related metal-dependent hydrolase